MTRLELALLGLLREARLTLGHYCDDLGLLDRIDEALKLRPNGMEFDDTHTDDDAHAHRPG